MRVQQDTCRTLSRAAPVVYSLPRWFEGTPVVEPVFDMPNELLLSSLVLSVKVLATPSPVPELEFADDGALDPSS